MVMMCQELTGKLPFRDVRQSYFSSVFLRVLNLLKFVLVVQVYLHSLIRDAHGRKMSKSLGNVVDPMDVREGITLEAMQAKLKEGNLDPREYTKAAQGMASDFPQVSFAFVCFGFLAFRNWCFDVQGIPECGVDAMRFALCSFSTQGRDINLDVLRIHGYRRFCNKIWQAVRLTLQKLGPDFVVPTCDPLAGHPDISPELAVIHAWILSRLARTIAAVNAGFKVCVSKEKGRGNLRDRYFWCCAGVPVSGLDVRDP
jgi:valyl-tRNA synthetase